MKISQMLSIKPGITAIIGAGGKTTLMYKLAKELSNSKTVIICTTTKIYKPLDFEVLIDPSAQEIIDALKNHKSICIGKGTIEDKLTSPDISFSELKNLADYVIVEADGAHRLPLKAHENYEPVIPEDTEKTVLVMGVNGFGAPISEICHRPNLYAKTADVSVQSKVTPEIAAKVINHEGLGDIVYINKVENEEMMFKCKQLAKKLLIPVVAGSLFKEEYICLR